MVDTETFKSDTSVRCEGDDAVVVRFRLSDFRVN